MMLRTLWGRRKSEDGPELMEAWDEVSVDQNEDGWRDACEKAIASRGHDLYAHRYIDVLIDGDDVQRAFWSPEIEGEVQPQ